MAMAADRFTAEPAHLAAFRAQGYAVVRGLFDAGEVAAIAAACDRVYAAGLRLGASWRLRNLFYRVTPDPALGHIVRLVQWPSYYEAVLNRFRLDRRLYDLAAPLIGPDLKQIINQLHWKPPGAEAVHFAFHQDCRFRRPAAAFRDLATSYVQIGIAIDPHNPDSGGMKFLPGSHLMGDLGLGDERPILDQTMEADTLRAKGLDPAALVDVVLEPGDVALWSPYLVHGSGANRTGRDRRLYINGFVRADAADRGEWAWRDGQPVPLTGEPAVIHFDKVGDVKQPFFVDEAPGY